MKRFSTQGIIVVDDNIEINREEAGGVLEQPSSDKEASSN